MVRERERERRRDELKGDPRSGWNGVMIAMDEREATS
jgi:hypothetical protein